MIAERLQRALGQAVIVDNRPGADGILGAQAAIAAPADGRTIFFGTTTTHVANPVLRRKLPYDPARDLVPVTLVGTTALVLLVHPGVPAKTVEELVKFAKANPGKLAFASAYASGRVAGEMFNQMAHVDMLHVPYKGVVAATTDLIGGQVQVMFGDLWGSLPHIQSGRLRALAVTGAQRTSAAPQLPTLAESGLPGYEMVGWGGFFVPARTPAAAITRLNVELTAIIGAPDIRKRMLEAGTEAAPGTPQALGGMIAADIERWRRIVELAHIEVID
jgi:tripartite-type tricarboxylate transporter receptor subunit TctC